MPTDPYIIALFAAGTALWEYPKWQERTNYAIPPISSDATPELTGLSITELQAIKAMAIKFYAEPEHEEALKQFSEENNNDGGGREAWRTWARPRFNEWKVAQDVEAVLTREGRHPRQLINTQGFVSARE